MSWLLYDDVAAGVALFFDRAAWTCLLVIVEEAVVAAFALNAFSMSCWVTAFDEESVTGTSCVPGDDPCQRYVPHAAAPRRTTAMMINVA